MSPLSPRSISRHLPDVPIGSSGTLQIYLLTSWCPHQGLRDTPDLSPKSSSVSPSCSKSPSTHDAPQRLLTHQPQPGPPWCSPPRTRLLPLTRPSVDHPGRPGSSSWTHSDLLPGIVISIQLTTPHRPHALLSHHGLTVGSLPPSLDTPPEGKL